MYFRFVFNAFVVIVFFVANAPLSLAGGPNDLVVGNFSAGDLSGWKEKVFKKKTTYKLVPSRIGMIVRSKSVGTASAFYKKVPIDLNKTPCLNWSWKVDDVLDGLKETTKSGDDYVARVYVVVSGGLAFWNTHAMNYVWSGSQPIGTSWPNAYTGNSINVAVQSGPTKVGQWVHESRNVKDDFAHLVGPGFVQADGVAIMTDTDDSHRSASASFGDIYFSKTCG